MVWWVPVSDSFHGETSMIAERSPSTDNWRNGAWDFKPRHIAGWQFLPDPPADRPVEAIRISLRGGAGMKDSSGKFADGKLVPEYSVHCSKCARPNLGLGYTVERATDVLVSAKWRKRGGLWVCPGCLEENAS